MPALDFGLFAALGELLAREFPDRVQEPEPWLVIDLVGAQQALVGERSETVDNLGPELARGTADRLRGVEVTAAHEHRQALEQPALGWRQDVVAPRDRCTQRLLPLRQIAGSRRQ